jgi:hypothetical protein
MLAVCPTCESRKLKYELSSGYDGFRCECGVWSYLRDCERAGEALEFIESFDKSKIGPYNSAEPVMVTVPDGEKVHNFSKGPHQLLAFDGKQYCIWLAYEQEVWHVNDIELATE